MKVVNKVLVVEPESSVASELRVSLAPASEEVTVVASAWSAIAWVDDNGAPDVAVIDLQLPDLDVATLVAMLRKRTGDALPRFFVSRDRRVRARFDQAPVLTVPFAPIEARAVLSETLIERDARTDR